MIKPSLTQAGFMGFNAVRQHHVFQHAAFLTDLQFAVTVGAFEVVMHVEQQFADVVIFETEFFRQHQRAARIEPLIDFIEDRLAIARLHAIHHLVTALGFADLLEAIGTLEGAIHKIDLETRDLLGATFNTVNEHFGRMFPELFGGGNARLVMTGDEILDAGVQVMAQPPGKKNSTIHLLSGGEKALTAIALVFAIFQLNPAPFCLLDEVDAPLDEANVGRFTSLVSEMSEQVQFLFVTHNKATMEAAQQLSGVTMREPGVSRLVSVDLAEAARLAGVEPVIAEGDGPSLSPDVEWDSRHFG